MKNGFGIGRSNKNAPARTPYSWGRSRYYIPDKNDHSHSGFVELIGTERRNRNEKNHPSRYSDGGCNAVSSIRSLLLFL
jgi:hypothetical protein